MDAGHGVSFAEATRVWARVAAQSFGGPAGQIAVMHRIVVEEKRWVSERRFLHALNYCMVLPGPEAQQLATYLGWLLHGTRGGLVAGGLFILPGFASILALSLLYAGYSGLPAVEGLFFGLKAAVLAVVVEALLRIGRRVLRGRVAPALAVGSFVALFAFDVAFPAVIAAAGAMGLVAERVRPGALAVPEPSAAGGGGVLDAMLDERPLARPRPAHTAAVAVTWGAIWWAPVLALALLLGPEHTWTRVGTFFGSAAFVTFGGAYAVLAYVAQQAVDVYGWLKPGEMLDGLGMAETTPGPLVQVVQFVGFMGAYRDPGAWPAWAAGVVGAVITTWVTFAPCFLWIFAGAPYVEWLRGSRRLGAALAAITAAVVGVIANLAVWFAVHVAFGEVGALDLPLGAALPSPVLATLDPAALALAAAAMVAMLWLRVGMLPTLAGCAAAGLAWRLLSAP